MCTWTLRIPFKNGSVAVESRYYYVCIPYTIELREPPRPRPPEPPRSFIPGVGRDVAWNVRTLATIDQLASQLPDEQRREIQHSIATQMEQLGPKLGSGVSLVRDVPEAAVSRA